MEIDQLRLFVEVARRGNFAAVARDRAIDPSSVSRVIAALETELGVRLFQRTTRRVALTEAGDLYLNRVEPLLNDMEHARDEIRAASAGPVGTLRLTASVAFGRQCVVPLLPRFRAQFPRLKLELLLSDTNLDLVGERVDLAVRLGPSFDSSLVGVKLCDTRYRVCASADYLTTCKPLRRPQDLAAHRCLLLTLPEFRTRWLFRNQTGNVTPVAVDGDLIVSNPLAVRDCALAGMGPCLLADWLIDEDVAAGRLVDLFSKYRVTATDFQTSAWLLYPSRTYLPNKVRATIDFLKRQWDERRP
jgi:DNA-binding transcriptional LysR family regulator